MGACPQLQRLHHNAWGATSGHLVLYMMLQLLSFEFYGREPEPVHCSLVEALMPLTRLQHLHLTQCVPLKYSYVLNCHVAKEGRRYRHTVILQGLHPCKLLCTCQTAGFASPLLLGVVVYCEGGGHRYQSGDGFSEMLLFEGLKTLQLHLANPPQQLYFAEGFSKLTGLTTVHLRRHFLQDDGSSRPTFSAFPLSVSPHFTWSGACIYTCLLE